MAANKISSNEVVGLRRSYYFSSNDRYEQEQNYQVLTYISLILIETLDCALFLG